MSSYSILFRFLFMRVRKHYIASWFQKSNTSRWLNNSIEIRLTQFAIFQSRYIKWRRKAIKFKQMFITFRDRFEASIQDSIKMLLKLNNILSKSQLDVKQGFQAVQCRSRCGWDKIEKSFYAMLFLLAHTACDIFLTIFFVSVRSVGPCREQSSLCDKISSFFEFGNELWFIETWRVHSLTHHWNLIIYPILNITQG
jgi:hypothetical protein